MPSIGYDQSDEKCEKELKIKRRSDHDLDLLEELLNEMPLREDQKEIIIQRVIDLQDAVRSREAEDSAELPDSGAENTNRSFGKWLAEQRKERRLTQEEAAALANLSTRTWSRIEMGSGLRRATAPRIAEALSIDIAVICQKAGIPLSEVTAIKINNGVDRRESSYSVQQPNDRNPNILPVGIDGQLLTTALQMIANLSERITVLEQKNLLGGS